MVIGNNFKMYLNRVRIIFSKEGQLVECSVDPSFVNIQTFDNVYCIDVYNSRFWIDSHGIKLPDGLWIYDLGIFLKERCLVVNVSFGGLKRINFDDIAIMNRRYLGYHDYKEVIYDDKFYSNGCKIEKTIDPDDGSESSFTIFLKNDRVDLEYVSEELGAIWNAVVGYFSKKEKKKSIIKQIASLKDEEWCFRPTSLQESETNYVNSGDVTYDDDAGHFNDFCNQCTISGAYESKKFLAVIIPEGTKFIPMKAFANCRNLRFVYIPDSVTLIDGGAFYGCRELIEVSLPKGINIVSKCHEWRHEYEWGPYDDVDHDDDYYYETFEDKSCLVYREQPLSADEWLANLKKEI